MILWKPNGTLDVATDPYDLPEQADSKGNVQSNAMARCKNLRLDLTGVIKTRDGSSKINSSALAQTAVWKIIEQGGYRYTFAGTVIYRNEGSIATGLTSAAWSAVKYNPYNSTVQSIYALNGTDRKRIEGSTVYEWGIAAPTAAPTVAAGAGSGLTGTYYYKYTYCRKESTTIVSESNPSSASSAITITNGLVDVSFTESSDTQVTHVRIYRTLNNGSDYYHLADVSLPSVTDTYSDNTDDGNLGSELEIDHYRPPLGSFLAGPSYNGILFIVKDNRLYFSKPKQPDYWPETYYIEISPLQDPGVGLILYTGQPYVATKHRLTQVQGTGVDTFFPIPLEAITGAQGANSALAVEGQGIFHFGSDGIYLYNGVDRKISQANFNPLFRGDDAGGLPGMTSATNSWIFQFKNCVYFGYTSTGYTWPTNILVLNLENQRVAHYTFSREIRTLCYDQTNDRLLAADNSGYIWRLEDSTVETDDGTAIAWEVESKHFGLQTQSVFPAGVKYDVNASDATGAKGELYLDGAVHQTHLLSDNRQTKKRLVTAGNGRRLSLRLSGSGPVSIYAAEILTE